MSLSKTIAIIIAILIAGTISYTNAQYGGFWYPNSDDRLQPVSDSWGIYTVNDIDWDGELLPDGLTCSDGEILKKTGADNWDCAADATGAGGSPVIFDIGDDGGNDSVDVSEIATTGDTNTIFTEPSADKILIAVGNNWPTADAATNLSANPTDCVANTFAQSIVASGNLTCSSIGDADVPNTITIDLAATATALAANGGNCSAGNSPLGVDTLGAVESCFDVWTEVENTSAGYISATLTQEQVEDYAGALITDGTGTHTGITVTYQDATGDVDMVIDHDAANNFLATEHVDWAAASAGTIHTDNYIEGHTNGANCSPGEISLGVDASGAVEGCYEPSEADITDLSHLATDITANIVNFNDILYTNTLAGNPALAVDECFLLATTAGGGFICEGSIDDTAEQLYLFPDVNGADTTNFIVVDGTQTTNIEGTGLSITTGTLNWSAASTDLTDTADLLYETELDAFSELQTQIGNKTLVNEEDVFTIDANWVNTANPWASNEITEADPTVDTESEIEAITGALFGTSKAVTSGYIWIADGVDFESVAMSSDCTIATGGAITCDHDALDNFVANEHLDWTANVGTIDTGNYIENATHTGEVTGSGALTIADSVTVTGWVLGTSSATQLTSPTLITDLIDATGAVDIDYGSADITDHTFISDGGTVVIDGAFIGALTGNADTVTTNANLTGEVTSTGNATVIVESFLQENGASELTGETLGTACSENQILKANATGGLDCAADAGGSTNYNDIGDPTGAGSITFADTETASYISASDGEAFFTINLSSADLVANTTALTISAVDNDDVNFIPFVISDDSGGTPDTLFQISSTGTITTGIWNAGNVTSSGTVEGATITEGGNAVYSSGETPSGELGGTYANITIDDNVSVSGWSITSPTFLTGITATDLIDSAHYAADSIDNEHINWADITNLDNAGAIIVADTTDTTSFVALWESATGSLAAKSDLGITYNAGTAALTATSFIGALTGNSSTATALAANPSDCAANTFADAIAANGDLTCNGVVDADVANDITINSTALITTAIGLDAVGAVDMDYGSGDVTDHTFITDGTGTAEIVLPAGSIDSTEILDSTIVTGDIAADTITHADIADADQADTKCIWFEDPVAEDDFKSIWRNSTANDFLLTELWAESDQTVTFMLQVDDGTPSDIDTVDLAPAAGEAEDTSLNGDTTVAASEELDLDLVSVANTPTWVSICWTGQWVD